jgi:hypothetical protein
VAKREDAFAQISVEDHGQGLSQSNLSKFLSGFIELIHLEIDHQWKWFGVVDSTQSDSRRMEAETGWRARLGWAANLFCDSIV